MALLGLNAGTQIKVPLSSLSNCSAKPFVTLALGTTAHTFPERSFANAGSPIRSFVNRKIFCSLNEDNLSVGTTPSQPSGFSGLFNVEAILRSPTEYPFPHICVASHVCEALSNLGFVSIVSDICGGFGPELVPIPRSGLKHTLFSPNKKLSTTVDFCQVTDVVDAIVKESECYSLETDYKKIFVMPLDPGFLDANDPRLYKVAGVVWPLPGVSSPPNSVEHLVRIQNLRNPKFSEALMQLGLVGTWASDYFAERGLSGDDGVLHDFGDFSARYNAGLMTKHKFLSPMKLEVTTSREKVLIVKDLFQTVGAVPIDVTRIADALSIRRVNPNLTVYTCPGGLFNLTYREEPSSLNVDYRSIVD